MRVAGTEIDVLPRRIPGESLRVSSGYRIQKAVEVVTVYRGVARIWDPLSPGTAVEITELPADHDALVRQLTRVRDALRAWPVSAPATRENG
jgi:hypothetical protein